VTILKSLVVCLALANAGYFLWTQGVAKSPDPAAGANPAATTLKLASEGPAMPPGSMPPGPGPGAGAGAEGEGVSLAGATGGADGAAHEEAAGGLLTNVKRCISVGPFRDVAETAHAASTLRSGGYDPRQRVAEGEVWAGVWVYLPVPSSRAANDQMLAKLKAAGIEDAMEMPGPNEASVISLGLFSESNRAHARVVQAQALGFNPGIADRKRTGNVYWIDIDLKPTDSVLKTSDLAGEAGRIVRLEVKACPADGSGAP
jgi:hypothetical protein